MVQRKSVGKVCVRKGKGEYKCGNIRGLGEFSQRGKGEYINVETLEDWENLAAQFPMR